MQIIRPLNLALTAILVLMIAFFVSYAIVYFRQPQDEQYAQLINNVSYKESLLYQDANGNIEKNGVNRLIEASILLETTAYIFRTDAELTMTYYEKFKKGISEDDPHMYMYTLAGMDTSSDKNENIGFEEFRRKITDGLAQTAKYNYEYAMIGRKIVSGEVRTGMFSSPDKEAIQASYLIGRKTFEFDELGRTSFWGEVASMVPLGIGMQVSSIQLDKITEEIDVLIALRKVGLISPSVLDVRTEEAQTEGDIIATSGLITVFVGPLGKVTKAIRGTSKAVKAAKLITISAKSVGTLLTHAKGVVGKAVSISLEKGLGKRMTKKSSKVLDVTVVRVRLKIEK